VQLIVAPIVISVDNRCIPMWQAISIIDMGKPDVFVAAALGTLLGLVSVAGAERSLTFALSGTCPTREAVLAAIEGAAAGIEIVTSDVAATASLSVSDEGSSYHVQVGRDTKTFIDASRDCAERALKVAVLAVLGLEPPVVEPKIPQTRTHVRQSGRMVLPPSFGVQIDVGGVIERALYAENGVASTGADVRVAIGRADLSLVIGVAMLTPVVLDNVLSDFMYASADITAPRAIIRVNRTPIDFAMRGRLHNGSMTAMLEAGPRFAVQRSSGTAVRSMEIPMRVFRAVDLELGARLAARFEFWSSSSYGVYFGLQSEYIHQPSRFMFPGVRGPREVAKMPSLWCGFSLGLAMRMH
jgi:hypothetical protein